MNGRDKFKEWAQHHDEVPIARGRRQSRLGGKLTAGLTHLEDDEASAKERHDRSEEFLTRPRETFPED